MSQLAEMGPDLARRNRAIIARRLGWPTGALEMCERLDAEHPGWSASWLPANDITGWERPAGFCASLPGAWLVGGDELRRLPEDGIDRRPTVFGPSVAELKERIAYIDARVEEGRQADVIARESIRRGIR